MKKWLVSIGLAIALMACSGAGGLAGTWRATETYQGQSFYYRYQLTDTNNVIGGTVAPCTDATFNTCSATTAGVTGTKNGNAATWAYQFSGQTTQVSGTLNGGSFSGQAGFNDQNGNPVTGTISMTKQ